MSTAEEKEKEKEGGWMAPFCPLWASFVILPFPLPGDLALALIAYRMGEAPIPYCDFPL